MSAMRLLASLVEARIRAPGRSRAAMYTSGDQETAASTLPALKTFAASTAEVVKTHCTSRLVSLPVNA
jgi:hypothetical protein